MKNEILYRIQKGIPFTQRPFADIADELNIKEKDVLDVILEEKQKGTIRQTSAIFDTKKLGYKSSLVAFEIEENNIDNAVEILNSHPGISHNYERNHRYNIWFTLAIDPTSKTNLEELVSILVELTSAKDFIILPTLKLFKIAVKLDTTNNANKKEIVSQQKYEKMTLEKKHYQIIKEVQNDLQIIKEPFKNIIERLNMSYEEFFSILQTFQDNGIMRRYATILNHRKAGFNSNAMVVWNIDEEKADAMGKIAASFTAVTHCYLRPKYSTWNYNLFTMIHGKTDEETQNIIDNIASEIDYKEYMPLHSFREFKKVRIKYFSDAFTQWENKYIIK